MLAGLFAKATGAARGKTTAHHMAAPAGGIMLGSAIVGASIPVAVGAALAFRMQRRDSVVVCFFGDGASQRGDFHEALNLAGVLRVPVVFVLENNGYAEMTPLRTHFAGESLAARAAGYGLPGVAIDGNDVLEVHETVQAAVDRARRGLGATLVEAVTYRQRGHSSSHPPTELRDPGEVEAWLGKDPLRRFRDELGRRGVMDERQEREIAAQVAAEIEDAVRFAEDSPLPDPAELTRDVYGTAAPSSQALP
jgi:TPP-dependent pyruvate/acetoin dehydrogenase alpha subunit